MSATSGCAAIRCGKRIPKTRAFCRRHWWMVPKENRDAIWDAYCNGTRDDSLEAIRDAMIIVAETEGVEL